MGSPCIGCEAACCVGRVVPLGDDEVERLAASLGAEAASFAARDDGGWRLGRRDDGACVFSIVVGGERRCGVHGDKPRACRIYPYHVAVRGDQWGAALGDDAACPPVRADAWRARLDDEREALAAAVIEDARAAAGTPRKLPVIGDSPCFGCATPCCFDYVVPVSAHDLWRLVRAWSVPWHALVDVQPTSPERAEDFALDGSGRRFALRLKRQPSGACGLLVSVGEMHRCGAHAARPLACRVYPLDPAWKPYAPIRLLSDARCPPAQRARFERQKPALAEPFVEDLSHRVLSLRVIERWDAAARARPPSQPYAPEDFVRWSFALWDELEPLWRKGPRGFYPRAEAVIAAFPLPTELAPGC